MTASAVSAVFPSVGARRGMYESFYLRAVDPERPRGIWIRYTVHKRPGRRARGALWCTFFDAARPRPFMHKLTSDALSTPAGSWIAIGEEAELGPGLAGAEARARAADDDAEAPARAAGDDAAVGGSDPPSVELHARGACGGARWSLRCRPRESPLRHLPHSWMYRAALPRTKLSSPVPVGSFDGTLELPGSAPETVALRDWPGMIGHNWGAEHAARWIWLHGLCFEESRGAWLDVAIGRIGLAGATTPWVANGVLALDGRRHRLGGIGARGLLVAETPAHCRLSIPGAEGLVVEAHVDTPAGTLAGWRYADPDGAEHDVSNCSIAALAMTVHRPGAPARTLRTDHGAAYELGMRERDHGVALAPFADG
jgi:hypothetical protein